MSVEMLKLFFRYNQFVLKTNICGLSHEESLHQPVPGGNCLNWVMGHIVATRNGVFKALGEPAAWNEETARWYVRGSAPITDGAQAVPFQQLVEMLHSSQTRIMAALDALDPEMISKPAGGGGADKQNETLGSQLTGLAFHEAYHAGQIGLLRRLLGKDGAIT